MNLRRRLPFIDDHDFPEKDRQHVDSILLLLNALNGFIDDFQTDLELFDYAEADLQSRM